MPALAYTPILIKFVPPIINLNDEPINAAERVRIIITTPSSNAYGVTQAIKRKQSLLLPSDGLLRLKLLASDCYLPMGRYKVEYFVGAYTNPIDVQHWVVPSPPPFKTIMIAHPDDSGAYTFREEDYVFDIINTSIAGGVFTYNYPQIVWSSGAPVAGQSYSVSYQPAVTLDQLIKADSTHAPYTQAY